MQIQISKRTTTQTCSVLLVDSLASSAVLECHESKTAAVVAAAAVASALQDNSLPLVDEEPAACRARPTVAVEAAADEWVGTVVGVEAVLQCNAVGSVMTVATVSPGAVEQLGHPIVVCASLDPPPTVAVVAAA